MAHVWAARALLPEMVERGEGYLLSTASAAGILTQVGALVYSVTKHAAVAVAEWLNINYDPMRGSRCRAWSRSVYARRCSSWRWRIRWARRR